MGLTIHYDIAALCVIAIIILLFFRRKNIPALQNRIFFSLLIDSFFMVFFEVISVVYIKNPDTASRNVIWFVNCLYFTATYLFVFIACCYCIAVVGFFENARRYQKIRLRFFLYIPIVIGLVFAWISPLYDCTNGNFLGVFYLDNQNVYQRGSFLFYHSYILSVYYAILAVFFLSKYKKSLKTKNLNRIIIYFVLCFSGAFVQLFMPNVLIQGFVISMATLVFEIAIRHPEDVIDINTGLLNNLAFINMNSRIVKAQNQYTCVGVVLDDVFFLTNTFGIAQFNKILALVSEKLLKEFPSYYLYYIGQGRFVLLIKKSTKLDVEKIISKLQNLFKQTWNCDSMSVKLYSRICVVECPKDASRAEDVIDLINITAEDERYSASVVYANEIDIEYKRRTISIEHALRSGLFENRFEVYYQPIYSTKERRLVGAEALIRLRDDDGNFISPEIFIPIAERTGVILRIGEFVFESVCKTLSEIDYEECGIEKIDVNLSVAQCMQEILADQILSISKMYKIPSSVINMEITETAMAHTPEVLLKNIEKLVEAGIEFSLDDYGSGYSNMNYMLTLPFSMIKIDKGIVWSAFSDQRANLALKSTISMISQLGMSVLAEGVETKEQAEWLIDLGCDYLQGFYYAKPMPKAEFVRLIQENKKY